jgi:hypothetical protein
MNALLSEDAQLARRIARNTLVQHEFDRHRELRRVGFGGAIFEVCGCERERLLDVVSL